MANITLKGNPIHTSGELPKVGQKAPDFVLVNKELSNKSLKDFSGKWKVLSIVPSLDTAVCSTMARRFNKDLEGKKNVVCLVISGDLPFAQGRFCEATQTKGIETLSMMRSKDFGKDYGVLIIDGPLAGICARAVLVLDAEDKVVYRQLVPEITEEPDYKAALACLA